MGSLPSLVPEPRILDNATTAAELIAAGLPSNAADRIVAFIAIHPGWNPVSAKDKQGQLLAAVTAYDKGSTPASTWKATNVRPDP